VSGHSVTGGGWSSSAGRLLSGIGAGVLARQVPPGLVDEVLEATGRRQRRFRALPSRLGVYFVLALCLFSDRGYDSVLAAVVSGCRDRLEAAGWRTPSSTALTKLRRRLGAEPFELLFRRLSGVWPCVPRPWSHAFGLLLVAWDGTNMDLADSAANAEAFGRPSCGKGPAGYPQVRMVVLMTCGSRRIIDAIWGTYRASERALAECLLPVLAKGMLLLADRGFPSYQLWCATVATGADLLWRVQSDLHLPVQQVLPDGSYLSRWTDPADSKRHAKKRSYNRSRGHQPPAPQPPRGPVVRVVEAVITVRTDDGTLRTGHYRLITTLLDWRAAPAADIAATYARRWACETGFREIKTYLRGSQRALRGVDPHTARQELWAYLIVYQAIRLIICQAASAADLDPGRISFTAACDAVQDAISTTPRHAEARTELIGRDLARRLITKHVTCRTCPRIAKRPLFHFPSRQASTELASRNVTYQLSVTAPKAIAAKPPDHHRKTEPPSPEAQPRAA
jgi:hypothetical protein